MRHGWLLPVLVVEFSVESSTILIKVAELRARTSTYGYLSGGWIEGRTGS